MQSITVKHYQEIEAYDGPHRIPSIRFRSVRPALGVSAWGMNVLELDAHCERCPEHNHQTDGQEEVYLVLEGEVDLLAQGIIQTLRKGMFARVPPETTRKLVTRESAAVILALGGTPGQAYNTSGL